MVGITERTMRGVDEEGAEVEMVPSPSPRPSPPGSGRTGRRSLTVSWLAEISPRSGCASASVSSVRAGPSLPTRGELCSPSLGERAGVRGNETGFIAMLSTLASGVDQLAICRVGDRRSEVAALGHAVLVESIGGDPATHQHKADKEKPYKFRVDRKSIHAVKPLIMVILRIQQT